MGHFVLEPVLPTVEVGQEIQFTGYNFYSNERLSIWATAPDNAVISGRFTDANDRGEISFSFRVPRDAIGGRWAMTVRGDRSKTPVIALFTVYGRSPETAERQANVSPPIGPPGTVFTFVARGYKASERVSYWFTDPDNNVPESHHRGADPDRNGRIKIEWTAPPDAKPGRWVITMQGYESTVARAIPFTIRGPDPQPLPPTATPFPTSPPPPTATLLPTSPPPPTATPTTAPQPGESQPQPGDTRETSDIPPDALFPLQR